MDVFDLVAKIRLDSSEYENGVGKAKGTFSTLASGVKTGLATVAKVGAAAVTAGVAGVTALTKMGVEGYAQYEQLVGGVETLFKESGNAVMKYAENAYKTSGLSSNAYMETVTSFSASLIKSLDGDTAKAAKVADMAITDMSDNANKMGTSIDMIQNAYNGFAKGNFTMLDNLKLGYGGTQEEMKKLLKDAEKISGIKYDISSFSDISEAIHVIQQDLEISGISYEEAMARVASGELTIAEATALMGTTAREAATTIEGSLSMMKGAWQNLVVGMADENANMEVLIGNFVESTATAAENLLPRIEQTLKGIGDLITALAPVIADAIPSLVASVLPSLLSAGVSLVTALVGGVITALPALYTALLEGVQVILVEVFGVSEKKAGEFADGVNSFFEKIGNGFKKLVKSAKTEGTTMNKIWTGLKDSGKALKDFLVALWETLSKAFKWCVDQINTEGTVLNKIWKTIQTVIAEAVNVIKNVIKLFTAVLKGDWTSAWNAIKEIASSVWNAIKSVVSTAIDAVKSTISTVMGAIKGVFSDIWNSIKSTISNVWESIKSSVSTAINNVKSAISTGLNNALSTVSTVLGNIKTKFSSIFNNCKKIVTDAVSAVKNAFNFSWSLPKLKLPRITVKGGVAPYGIGGKGSLPKFSIEWFKKAYDNAMILSKPTIFGYSDASGKFLGGGDGNGNEIVAGESYLMGLISKTVESKNERIVSLLAALLEATVDGNTEMARAMMADRTFAVGEREFARLVKTYA